MPFNKGGSSFEEKYEQEFKQLMLLASNILWLALEWLYLDTTAPIQFPIIRLVYFSYVGIVRAEGAIQRDPTDLDAEDEIFTKEVVKTAKVWCTDVASWFLLIWAFGRSIM